MRPPLAVRFMPLSARPLGFVAPPIVAMATAVGLGFLAVRGPLDLIPSCFAAAVLAVASAMVMAGDLPVFVVAPAMVMPRFATSLVVASAMVMPCFASAVRPFTAALTIVARMGAVTITVTLARTVLALDSAFPVAIALGLALVARSTVPPVPFTPFIRCRTDPVETRQSHH